MEDKLYRCLECGHVTDSPKIEKERVCVGETSEVYQVWYYCPACGGDLEQVVQCQCCEKYFREEEVDEHDICEECQEDLLTISEETI